MLQAVNRILEAAEPIFVEAPRFQIAANFVSRVAAGSWINARTAQLPREVEKLRVELAGAQFSMIVQGLTFAPHR